MSLSKRIILTVRDYTVRLSSAIKLYQNDQLYLIFEINKYGIDVDGMDNQYETIMPINPLKANLFFETPLGTDSVESVDIIDNTVTFHLESRHTQHIGISKMQIQLIDEGCCQITLPDFPFEIRENIYDNVPLLRTVLLSDEEDTLLVDENGNALNVGTEVVSQTYAIATVESSMHDITTKQIKDYDLDTNITGVEDILVQDEGVTKRVKVSGLIQGNINLNDYYTKTEIESEYYTKEEVKTIINETPDPIADDIIFTTDMTTVSPLGGISAGTDLNNMSVQEVLTKLLFPYVAPTVSASLTYNPSGNIFECGNSITITAINGTVTKKSDSIISVRFLDSSTILQEITSGVGNTASYRYTFPTPITITSNLPNTRFRFSVTDASNKTYYANTVNVNFYYPYYFGVINENEELTNELFSTLTKKVEAKGNKTNDYTTSNQCMLMAYPKSYGELKKILDANSFDVTATFTKNEFNVVGLDGTSQPYYVYINNASSVTNFRMTFQY